jgi:hypothetical protein
MKTLPLKTLLFAIVLSGSVFAQSQPADAISGRWSSDIQFVVKELSPSPTYFWVGHVDADITPTGRINMTASNGCKVLGLLSPVPGRKGVFKGAINITQCQEPSLNRTYPIDAMDIGGNLKISSIVQDIAVGKVRAIFEVNSTLARR